MRIWILKIADFLFKKNDQITYGKKVVINWKERISNEKQRIGNEKGISKEKGIKKTMGKKQISNEK